MPFWIYNIIFCFFTLAILLLAHLLDMAHSDPITPVPDQASLLAVSKAAGDFNVAFYNILAKQNPNTNLILSGLSCQIVLSMLIPGSASDTETELLTGLKYSPNNEDTVTKGMSQLLESLKGNENVTVNIANRIYTDTTFDIYSAYKDILINAYKSSVGIVDFNSNPEPSREEINTWVANQTQSKIQNLLPQGTITTDTRSVLVNAMYFKGKWKHQFNKNNTYAGDFYVDENNVQTVQYMTITDNFGYANIPELDAKVLELPYSGDYSMLIILPNQKYGLAQVEEKLASQSLASIKERLYYPEVNVKIPKFKIESSFNLNEALKQLGMTSMFNSAKANFSKISNERLFVSDVVQKAFVEVDEEGTTAAAATGGLVRKRRCCVQEPEEFVAELPFIFFVYHQQSRLPIFLAHVVQPPPASIDDLNADNEYEQHLFKHDEF